MARLGSIPAHNSNGQFDVVLTVTSLGLLLCMVIAVFGIKLRWFRKRIQFDQIPSGSRDSRDDVVLRRSSRNFQEQFSEPVVAQGIFRKKLDEDIIIERPKTLPPVKVRNSSTDLTSFVPAKRSETPATVVEEPVVIPPTPPPLPPSISMVSLSSMSRSSASQHTPIEEKVNFAPMVEIIPNGKAKDAEIEPLHTEEALPNRQLSGRKQTGYTKPSDDIIAELQKMSDEVTNKYKIETELQARQKSSDGSSDKQNKEPAFKENGMPSNDADSHTKIWVSQEQQKISVELSHKEPELKENGMPSNDADSFMKILEPQEQQKISIDLSNKTDFPQEPPALPKLSYEMTDKKTLEQQPPEPLPRKTTSDKHRFKKHISKTVKSNVQIHSHNHETDDADVQIETRKLGQRRPTGIFPSADEVNGHLTDDSDDNDDEDKKPLTQNKQNKVIFNVEDSEDEGKSSIPPPIRSPPPVLPPMLFITQVSNEEEDIEICDSWSAIQKHRNLTQEINDQKEANPSPIEDLYAIPKQKNHPTTNSATQEQESKSEMKRNNAQNDLLLNSEKDYGEK